MAFHRDRAATEIYLWHFMPPCHPVPCVDGMNEENVEKFWQTVGRGPISVLASGTSFFRNGVSKFRNAVSVWSCLRPDENQRFIKLPEFFWKFLTKSSCRGYVGYLTFAVPLFSSFVGPFLSFLKHCVTISTTYSFCSSIHGLFYIVLPSSSLLTHSKMF